MAGHRYSERSPQESVSLIEKQDAKLDRFLEEMKPFVLRLPHKLERQRVGLWIKKLCEPPGASPSSRKNRNLYAQLLLHMLKRGLLEDPFTRRPDAGLLQPLPSYMSIYLDEPITKRIPSHSAEEEYGRDPPDWVRDLGNSSASSSIMSGISGINEPRIRRELPTTSGAHPMPSARSTTHSSSSRGADRPNYMADYDHDLVNGNHGYRPRLSLDYPNEDNYYIDEEERDHGDLEDPVYTRDYRHSDSGHPSSSPPSKSTQNNGYSHYPRGTNLVTSFRDDLNISKPQEREVELKIKMVEAKYHEEKLKLQQQHDVAVQKILDRKNMELEEVKSHYRNKISELEAAIKQQERKIAQVNREASTIKEQKDKQIAELKSLAEQSGESAQNDYEKKLNDKIAEFEAEKFEMQKQHTNNIQELLDETNQRLQKMEAEYNKQSGNTALVVQELETRVHQLTEESVALQNSRVQLGKSKEELADKVLTLTSQLKEAKSTISKYERDRSRMMNDHQAAIQQIQRKTDSTIELMKKEHAAAMSRSADAISDLESQLAQSKQSLQDAEFQRQKQVREMESTGQQDKLNLENLYDKKFRSLQAEMDQQGIEHQKRVRKLEDQIKEREEQIQRLTEMQKQQSQQAERALEDFKNQVEKNSARMFDEMKSQMEKVEEDLAHSKSLREKQSREYSRQMDDMKMKHDKQIAELKISHEQEKAQMLRSHQAERDSILREQEQERDLQSEKLHQKMMDIENQSRERTAKDAKTNSELEQQVRELREEVMQANSLRKTQLMELNLLREEEKQAYKRQEENLQTKAKSELEQQKLDLKRAHSAEMEQLLEKTNERLKMMEEEFTSRSEKAQEANRTLEEEIKRLREDHLRTRLNYEKKMNEVTNKFNEEKAALKKHRDSIVGSLEQDSQAQKSMVRHLEKRCQQIELEAQEKISRLRLKYEEKMKGLMPESVREELEDTIESLRQQVSVLQSRAQVLQEELDTRNKFSMSSFNVSTSYRDESDRQAV